MVPLVDVTTGGVLSGIILDMSYNLFPCSPPGRMYLIRPASAQLERVFLSTPSIRLATIGDTNFLSLVICRAQSAS